MKNRLFKELKYTLLEFIAGNDIVILNAKISGKFCINKLNEKQTGLITKNRFIFNDEVIPNSETFINVTNM